MTVAIAADLARAQRPLLLALLHDPEVRAAVLEIVASTADEYTSVHLPDDCRSRDRFRRYAKAVPGSYRVGHVWHVPRDAWHRARTRRTAEVVAAPSTRAPDDLMSPREALAAAGARPLPL